MHLHVDRPMARSIWSATVTFSLLFPTMFTLSEHTSIENIYFQYQFNSSIDLHLAPTGDLVDTRDRQAIMVE